MGKKTHKNWSTEEIRKLRKEYGSKSIAKLASEMDRTYQSILSKASGLNLTGDKHTFNDLDLSPSPHLAYILGVVKGDGSCFDAGYNQYVISIDTVDRDFAKKFKSCCESLLGKSISITPGAIGNENKGHRVRIYSKVLFNFIKNSNTAPIIEKYPSNFLQGFYDSDGSVTFRHRKGKTYRTKVKATNNNRSTLKMVKKLLSGFNINGHIGIQVKKGQICEIRGRKIETKKDCYSLSTYDVKSILNFAENIGFNIRSKQEKLDKIVEHYS